MFFSTRNLPAFAGLSLPQRLEAIEIAKNKLALPKTAILHIVKFLLIAPIFFIIATVQSWSVLPWIVLLFLLYPLVTKPLTLYFVKEYLADSVVIVKAQSD